MPSPQADLLIAKYGRPLVIVLCLVGVLALVATGWVVANPTTTTTAQEVNSETLETTTDTHATVIRTGLWEEGTTLENQPVYTTNATPVVELEPATTVPNEETTVTHDVTLTYEAVRDDSVFWEETEHLGGSGVSEEDADEADANATAHAPVEDGVATSSVSMDVEAVNERIDEIESELRGVGSIELTVTAVAEYDTGTYTGENTASTEFHVTDDAYWFDGSLTDSQTHSETATVEVSQGPDPLTMGGLLLVSVLAFGSAATIFKRSPVDEADARLALQKRRHAEWISRGRIPMWVGEYQVALDTLTDVVDVAIDSKQRVVYDKRRELFAVINDDTVYYYSQDSSWEETAWPTFAINQQQGGGDGAGGVPGPDRGPDSETPPSEEFDPSSLPDPDDDDAWKQL